jgi:acetyl esterase/lipase
MRGFRKLAFGLMPLLLAGCSAAGIVNALTPRSGYTIVKDQAYGEGPRRRLDVYLPVSPPQSGLRPMVVFFYGGSWQEGSKETYLFAGQALASKGFIVVIPDYRLYPEVRYPVFLEDTSQAVRWTIDHAPEFGGDPKRVYLMGHSAGAYIAAMLTVDPRWLHEVGLDPRKNIRAMVGLAGPYDFLPIKDPVIQTIFGAERQWPATQPINHVYRDEPPLLLLVDDGDETVNPGNTVRLAARIRDKGGVVEEKHYPGLSHTKLVGALAAPLRFLAPTLDDSVDFMNRYR